MRHSTKKRVAILVLGIPFLAIAIHSCIWTPHKRQFRVMDLQSACFCKPSRHWSGITAYTEEFGDLPKPGSSWEALLVGTGLIEHDRFVCPVRRDREFRYRYLEATTNGSDLAILTPTVCDPSRAHWEENACNLFANSHVPCMELAECFHLEGRPTPILA